MSNRVVAVIPARYAASRFPGKLMKPLGQIPVIQHTWQNVQNAQIFDEVILVTDSDEIQNHLEPLGARVFRSKKVHPTGSDRIAEIAPYLDADIIINVQGDEPFIQKEPLQQLISCFEKDVNQEISLASLKMKLASQEVNNPNIVKVITDVDGYALYFSRSPIPYLRAETHAATYYRHIGVYAFRKEALLNFALLSPGPLEKIEMIECLRFLENKMKIKMIETNFIGVGIDTPEDLERAKHLLNL